MIKCRIAESIVEEMFRELGFFVMRLGKEYTVSPLTQIQEFVEQCNGKFLLEKAGEEIREVTQINTLPDFVVVHPSGKVTLLEVKFRWNGILYPKDELVFSTYPETHMLTINLEVGDNIIEGTDKDGLNKLKNTRFHIWFKEDCTNDDSLSVCILKEWLEEFDINNEAILKKYEELVEKWMGNETVFRKNGSSAQ